MNFIPADRYIPLQQIDPELVLVAEEEDQLVVFIIADEDDVREKIVVIETVFVLQQFRRQGLGSQLVGRFTKIWQDTHGFDIHLYAVGEDSYFFFKSMGWDDVWAKIQKKV